VERQRNFGRPAAPAGILPAGRAAATHSKVSMAGVSRPPQSVRNPTHAATSSASPTSFKMTALLSRVPALLWA
jgi:hypothetical protein